MEHEQTGAAKDMECGPHQEGWPCVGEGRVGDGLEMVSLLILYSLMLGS